LDGLDSGEAFLRHRGEPRHFVQPAAQDLRIAVEQQYICVKEEVPVAREDMAKGYEFEKDQYVMFSPEELKALEEAGTHTADIAEFVRSNRSTLCTSTRPTTSPRQGRREALRIARAALRESKRCALGRWAARGKQYIVMIRPVDDGLVMQQLLTQAK